MNKFIFYPVLFLVFNWFLHINYGACALWRCECAVFRLFFRSHGSLFFVANCIDSVEQVKRNFKLKSSKSFFNVFLPFFLIVQMSLAAAFAGFLQTHS